MTTHEGQERSVAFLARSRSVVEHPVEQFSETPKISDQITYTLELKCQNQHLTKDEKPWGCQTEGRAMSSTCLDFSSQPVSHWYQ